MRAVRFAPTLGTAQLGIPYGVANVTGMPTEQEAQRIIHRAIDWGVSHIDTVRAYGASEERIGAALTGCRRDKIKLVTKVAPLRHTHHETMRAATQDSIAQSYRALRADFIDVLLLHRCDMLNLAEGAAWQCLVELRSTGRAGLIGVSAQNAQEVATAAMNPDVGFIQLHYNLLDHRYGWLMPLRDGLTVHARSTLLQGLLAGGPLEVWPPIAGLDQRELVERLECLVGRLERRSMADLALAYVRAQPWVESIVFGVETLDQLEENLALFETAALSRQGVRTVDESLPRVPERLLDPAKWYAV